MRNGHSRRLLVDSRGNASANGSIYYVTTFNKRLYEFSGREMLNGFINTGTDGRIIVAYEEDCDIVKSNKVIPVRIDKDPYLIEWVNKFKAHIPPEYGGTRTNWSRTKGVDFCRQTARWYRKIVALKRALDYAGPN